MYEETNPPDISALVVQTAIESCFPHIVKPKIRFHYHGTYNVFIVEEEYLFRFPSKIIPLKEQQKMIRRESSLLESLHNRFSFEIPVPEFIDSESDTPYMGYRMIPGSSLSRHFDSTSAEVQRFLGKQVGTFLSELHAIDGNDLVLGDDGTYSPRESISEFQGVFSQVQDIIIPHLSKLETEWTETLFHDFLDSEENFEFEPVLIHGDFDTSNILVDPETASITGIIDFEETRVYDSASDFIFLREGVEFLTSLLDAYKGTIDPYLVDRIIFRLGRQPFIYILWGTEHNLEPMISYGYATLKDHISNWKRYVSVANHCFR